MANGSLGVVIAIQQNVDNVVEIQNFNDGSSVKICSHLPDIVFFKLNDVEVEIVEGLGVGNQR